MGVAVLAAAALLSQAVGAFATEPWLPTQFSGRVRTTAHLIDPVRVTAVACALRHYARYSPGTAEIRSHVDSNPCRRKSIRLARACTT